MPRVIPIIVALFLSGDAAAQKTVSFPTDDRGVVYADAYGEGDTGIVLAHGGRFNKESWEKEARTLATSGFRVLALDFRGYGKSRGPGESDPMSAPLHLDVLAAVRYLRKTGAKSVSVVGAAWEEELLAMHQSLRGWVRSIGWYYWAQRRMARPTSSSHPPYSLWQEMMQATMGRVSPGFANNTRKLPNPKS